jgi:DNA mismatch repair ATPase MutS
MWTTQCALAVETWRDAFGKAVPLWLSTVGQLEALVSLAGYGYEHPRDPFPEIRDSDAGALFDATGIGHPLLPEARVIRNDVRLDADMRLLVVSGSNMSGKSTLLRTVGINAVLALAGAPVRAERLRISPVAVGATLRIQDSLEEGTSRFYAEIKRMRQLVEIAEGPLPLLFLLDEIFHGTNSHDRRIGAEAVIGELVKRGAVGLVTTHDLALSDIAEGLAPRARNVHFEDHLENGRVTFDFKLRDGIVEKSNALELMRSVGLDV